MIIGLSVLDKITGKFTLREEGIGGDLLALNIDFFK